MIETINVGNSTLITSDDSVVGVWAATINNYFTYVKHNIIMVLEELQPNVSVAFNFNNNRSKHIPPIDVDINIGLQFEQQITSNHSGGYEIKPQHRHDLQVMFGECDIVVEYSNPIIHLTSTYDDINWYKNKAVYIPNVFKCDMADVSMRTNDSAVLLGWSPRRTRIILENATPDSLTASTMEEVKHKLDAYKILIDIQQNEETKTFAEIRCAAILSTGILIISEKDCPFLESIPYHKHIVWTTEEEFKTTFDDVLINYNMYREKYLTGLQNTLDEMNTTSYNSIKNAILNVMKTKRGK